MADPKTEATEDTKEKKHFEMDLGGLQKRLSETFNTKDYKTRRQSGMDLMYISTDTVIRRLNRAMGITWSERVASEEVFEVGRAPDKDYRKVYRITIAMEMHDRKTGHFICSRIGVGCDNIAYYGRSGGLICDPDKAIKTAHSEAIKNAAKTFGVALELWDQEYREEVKKEMQEGGGALNDKQKEEIKKLKEQMNIKEKSEWDVYIKHWSDKKYNGKHSTIGHLNNKNVDDFIAYVKENKDTISPV